MKNNKQAHKNVTEKEYHIDYTKYSGHIFLKEMNTCMVSSKIQKEKFF